jgi:hypothetical protein
MMYKTLDEIQALFGVEHESVSLEFKDGTKLDGRSDVARTDIVTDVTAFANAGGGTVIYGVTEERRDGRSFASAFAPVTDPKVTQDWLREVIVSNTDPVLRGFSINTIQHQEGTIFVVFVEEGDTAYQNRRNCLYYSRADASAKPMYGFAIRDVMNRRRTARLRVEIESINRSDESDKPQYVIVPKLVNDGLLTAHHWVFRVAIPDEIGTHEGSLSPTMRKVSHERNDGVSYSRYEYSSECIDGRIARILPGETASLNQSSGYGAILVLRVIGENHRRIAIQNKPQIYWTLFVDDAARQDGTVRFEDWCSSIH